MDINDLTIENLETLISISDTFTGSKNVPVCIRSMNKTPEEIFLFLLWRSNFELFEEDEFDDDALDFIYKKDLSEMPKFINDRTDDGYILKEGGDRLFFNWIPIVARWRLTIGR